MRGIPALKHIFAIAMGAVFVMGAAQVAFAGEYRVGIAPSEPDQGGKNRHVVIEGVVASVSEDGALLVVDKGEEDTDAADDVTVQLTDQTKVSPKGTAVTEGALVRIVAQSAEDETAPLIATMVSVKKEAPDRKAPEKGKHARPVKACGVISELPEANEDGALLGEWVVEVLGLATNRFMVTEQTKVVPPDVPAEVGGSACFQAMQVEGEWIAKLVQLKAKPKLSHRKGATKIILHGSMVGDPPEDLAAEWSLEIALSDGSTKTLVVRPDTEIEGELADGAALVVHAVEETDASGAKVLVAEKIKVADCDEEGAGKAEGAVHFKGTVSSIADDVWTIATEEEDLTVVVDDETKIIGLDEGADPVGRDVSGHAKRAEDGELVARLIKFETV